MKEVAKCENCHSRYYKYTMKEIDVSLEDEYYPNFIYICKDCQMKGGE